MQSQTNIILTFYQSARGSGLFYISCIKDEGEGRAILRLHAISVGPAGPIYLYLFHSFLRLPFHELPLPLLAVVIGDDVRQQTSGNGLNAVFRDICVIDEFFLLAHCVPLV